MEVPWKCHLRQKETPTVRTKIVLRKVNKYTFSDAGVVMLSASRRKQLPIILRHKQGHQAQLQVKYLCCVVCCGLPHLAEALRGLSVRPFLAPVPLMWPPAHSFEDAANVLHSKSCTYKGTGLSDKRRLY